MTVECLPKVIQDSLFTIIKQHEFISPPKISCKKSVSNNNSSCWKIEINDCKSSLKLFVKHLDTTSDYFASESAIYFQNELIFYHEILKDFRDVTDNSCECVSQCYNISSDSSENLFIIMEDLSSLGYLPMDIKNPLSVDCAQTILQQLGQFHAYSFAIKDQRPQTFTNATSKLCESVFRQDTRATLGKLFIHSIHDVFKLAKQSFPFDSIYVEKFATFTLNIFDRMSDLLEGDDEDAYYKVLTHGDLWPNNILYKVARNSETINNPVKFIDFQACRVASPVHDLMFILLVGLDNQTRQMHRADLIKVYQQSLCETLEKLGSDPLRLFPFSALENQILKHTQFVLALALVGLPLFLNEEVHSAATTPKTSDVGNLDNLLQFVQDVQTRKTMQCKNKMLELIIDCVDNGYL